MFHVKQLGSDRTNKNLTRFLLKNHDFGICSARTFENNLTGKRKAKGVKKFGSEEVITTSLQNKTTIRF